MKRLFVGLPLTEEARAAVAAGLDSLPIPLPGKVTPPANWHLTLSFLGETGEDRQAVLESELSRSSMGSLFPVTLGGFGGFPNFKRARVLWLGLTRGLESLGALAENVIAACEAAGFPRDRAAFTPHITLSRLPASGRDISAFGAQECAGVELAVTEVVLYWSRPGPRGVVYEKLKSYPLGR